MLKSALTDTNNQLDSASLQQLVTQTEGFSGSDVAVLVKDILMEAVRITQQATTVRYGWTPCIMYVTTFSHDVGYHIL